MRSLQGKVVVITGAGSGIGRALAVESAKKGAILALADWNEEGLKETQTEARAKESIVRKLDVRSEEGFQAFASDVQKELGGAHVVVNNAGVSLSDTVGSMKRSDFEWLIDINFWGVVRGTETFLPQLLSKDDGHIVNISSVFGLIGVPSQSAYNASKFAVRGYTEALRQELEEAGAVLDDPEALTVLDGGLDDPDGVGGPTARELARAGDTEGWDLDAPEVPGSADDADDADGTAADI